MVAGVRQFVEDKTCLPPRFSGCRPVRLSGFVAAGTLVAALAATAGSALETPVGKPQKQAGMEVAAVAPIGASAHPHFGWHTDKETGVGPWFKPLTVQYEFTYAGTGKKGGY